MSTKKDTMTISLQVAADHSADAGKAFTFDGTNAAVATTLGELAPYLLEGDPSGAGEFGVFSVMGQTQIRLGATVGANVKCSTAADGRFTTALITHEVLAITIDGGVADDLVRAIFLPMGIL